MPQRQSVLAAFGRSVRKHREVLGLSQEALAEKAGLHATYISGIERGIRNPSIHSVARIAKALGTSISELCLGVGWKFSAG
jgi:transcriptional regulator with XRE-family HTH domain